MPFTSDNTKTSLIFSIYIMNGYRKPSASHFLHITSTMTLGHFIYLRLHFIRRPTDRLLFALPFPSSNNAPFQRLAVFTFLSFLLKRWGLKEIDEGRNLSTASIPSLMILFCSIEKPLLIKLTNIRNFHICKKNMTTVVVNFAFQFVIDVMKDDKWIVKGRLQSPIHSVYAQGYNFYFY